jgi:cobalt-zinc-cadmium efflux system outer membrane protein
MVGGALFASSFLWAMVVVPTNEVPLPSHVTLADALRIFRERGFDLIIAEAQVDSAEGDVKVAGAVPNPSVGVSFGHAFTYQPESSDPSNSCSNSNASCTSNTIGLDLSDQAAISDTLSGKRGLRLRVAKAALVAARQSRVDAQRTLEFQVKQQYLQAVLARDQLDFQLEVQKSYEQTLKLTQTRFDKGAISEADVAKVEVAKLEADQSAANARSALRVARANLAFLIGVRGSVPEYDVDPDLPKYVLPARLAQASAATLLADAIDHRPDLKAQIQQRERAEAAVRLAKRQRMPDLTLSVNYQQAGSGGIGTNAPLQPPTLTFGLSAPIPLFYQQQGEIRKAEADLKTQDTQRSKIEAQVVNDVQSAFVTFTTTRELVERMQGRLLERAKRVRDLSAFQYQKGAASLLEFLDAQRTYIATNVEYLQDLANYWIALFQLEEAVGTDLTQ